MPRLGKQNSVRGRAGRSLCSPGHGPTSRHWPPTSQCGSKFGGHPWALREGRGVRIWAGLHYRFSTRVGTDMGYQIGEYVVKSAMQPGVAASRW